MTEEESTNIITGEKIVRREQPQPRIQPQPIPRPEDLRFRDTIDLAQQQNMALKSQPETFDRFTRPHMIRNSKYHLYESKNLIFGNLSDNDGKLISLFAQHKNLSLHMEAMGLVSQDIPDHVNTIEESWIGWKRGIGGMTANLVGKQQMVLTTQEEKPPDKNAFKQR